MHTYIRQIPGLPRRGIAGLAASCAAIVWVHTLTALFYPFSTPAATDSASAMPSMDIPAAGLLTSSAILATWAAAALGGPAWRWATTALGAGAGLALILGLSTDLGFAALALPLTVTLCAGAAGALAPLLPERLDLALVLNRRRALLWLCIALLAVVQVGRLTTWAASPGEHSFFLATSHPFWGGHECLPAYLYAAELTEGGESNPWHQDLYPGLSPDATAESRIAGMVPEDPYEYPPQFLLLPRLALASSGHYTTLRLAWLAINFSLIFGTAVLLSLFVGGRVGLGAGLALPLFAVAFPTLYNLQYGQVHLAAVALGLLGMLAFEKGRNVLGGACMAAAILTKLFPAVLLVALLARRRWQALAATFAWGMAATVATLAVFGAGIFEAFFSYHLPRLASGAAVDFGGAWPELAGLVTAANQGPAGWVAKLEAIGLPTGPLATWLPPIYGVALLGLTFVVCQRRSGGLHPGEGGSKLEASRQGTMPGSPGFGLSDSKPVSFRSLDSAQPFEVPEQISGHPSDTLDELGRRELAICWLAILGLASLASPAAFADYVPAVAVWMATMAVSRWPTSGVGRGLLAVALFFQLTLLGSTALGPWTEAAILIPLSILGAASLMGLFLWGMGPSWRRQPVADPFPSLEAGASLGAGASIEHGASHGAGAIHA